MLLSSSARRALALAASRATRARTLAADAADAADALTIPGARPGRVPLTPTLTFFGGRDGVPPPPATIPAYRTLTSEGAEMEGAAIPAPGDLSRDAALAVHRSLVTLQTMDALFYECQRQGRFAFYMTCAGEEGTTVGAAAGLEADDPVFAQYREQGVLLHRGWPLRAFADQCYGNGRGHGKGRQMPIHYGSKEVGKERGG